MVRCLSLSPSQDCTHYFPVITGILAGMKQMREGSYGREKLVGFVRKQ